MRSRIKSENETKPMVVDLGSVSYLCRFLQIQFVAEAGPSGLERDG